MRIIFLHNEPIIHFGYGFRFSERTVRNHVSSMLAKLQLSNRVELTTYSVKYHNFDKLGERLS